MKLNKEGKSELRKIIEDKLKQIVPGERVHLDKGLLEQLLFEEIVYDKKTGAKLKLPIWSGKFLCKVDLSEISFENVSWSILCDEYYDCGYDEFLDEEIWNKFNNDKEQGCFLAKGDYVRYEFTNANIDFTKSWEYKVMGEIILNSCSFWGTDLSKNDMSKVRYIRRCLLSDTNLNMPSPDKMMPGFHAEDSSFYKIDLSGYTLDATKMVMGSGTSPFDVDCYLAGTGAKIINYTKEAMEQASVKEGFDLLGKFNRSLREDYFSGCYINGKLFQSSYDRKISAKEMKKEHEKMKADLFADTIQSIEQQISGFGRK